ncbi:hypothetical protein Plhal304r1_c081g0166821 [Plasmopara halstedii]
MTFTWCLIDNYILCGSHNDFFPHRYDQYKLSMSKPTDKKMNKPTDKKINKPTPKAASPMKDDKVPMLVVVTEEDDEFEEFEDADWNGQAEEKDAHIKQQWQDDWDVDEADDDFCNQLRKELQKTS